MTRDYGYYGYLGEYMGEYWQTIYENKNSENKIKGE